VGIRYDIVLERRACKAVTDLAMLGDELLNSILSFFFLIKGGFWYWYFKN